jgi:hypothetical protein
VMFVASGMVVLLFPAVPALLYCVQICLRRRED